MVQQLARGAALVFLVIAAACGPGGPQADRFVARDSAGVRILESVAPAWGEERRWTVDPEPLVSIGSFAGDPAEQLHRVSGLVRASDGRIIVANGGSNEIRIYSPEGAHLVSVGRRGSGPGEFERLWGVYVLPGDSLLTFDAGLSRSSLFDSSGNFVRVIEPADSSAWRLRPFGTLRDGSLITTQAAEPYSHLSLPSGFLRHPTHWIRRAIDLTPLDTIGTFLSEESLNAQGSNWATYLSAPFLRPTFATLREEDVVIGEAERYELSIVTLDGLRRSIIRRAYTPQMIPTSALDLVREVDDPELRAILARIDFPETYPAYSGLVADAEGNIWVREFRDAIEAFETWTAFSPEGEWLGSVDVPRTLGVTEIGEDYILALTADELGVEYVRVYRLNR